jgi:hypothetical protein
VAEVSASLCSWRKGVAEGSSQPTMEPDSDGFREADSIHQSHTTPGGGGGGGEGDYME